VKRVALAVATASGLLLPASVFADDGPRAPIRITYEDTSGCGDGDAFFDEVAGRTARVRRAEGEEPARLFAVRIAPSAGRLAGDLTVVASDGRHFTRHVDGATCAEIVDALALIIALSVDPYASATPRAAAPPPKRAEQQPPAPAPATPRTPIAPAAAPAYDAGWSWSIAALGELNGAVAPKPVLGPQGSIDLARRSPSVWAPSFRFDLTWTPERSFDTLAGITHYQWYAGRLEACPIRIANDTLSVIPCGAFETGVVRSSGAASASASDKLWLAFLAIARASWSPTSAFRVEIEGGGVFPVLRNSYAFDPHIIVYRVPKAAAVAGVGVAFPLGS
jgi:hypothetical protein